VMSAERESWHIEQWFTSRWNRDTEVAGSFVFPALIEIRDVTLRTGEQQAGVEFTADDRVRIAGAFAEASVQRIEAGLGGVSPTDEEACAHDHHLVDGP
jgi:HMGL-like